MLIASGGEDTSIEILERGRETESCALRLSFAFLCITSRLLSMCCIATAKKKCSKSVLQHARQSRSSDLSAAIHANHQSLLYGHHNRALIVLPLLDCLLAHHCLAFCHRKAELLSLVSVGTQRLRSIKRDLAPAGTPRASIEIFML